MYIKKGVIDRIEQNKAVITLEDGQNLVWELDNLPQDLTVGSEVVLELKTRAQLDKKQQELAKSILNEIFFVQEK